MVIPAVETPVYVITFVVVLYAVTVVKPEFGSPAAAIVSPVLIPVSYTHLTLPTTVIV